MAVVIEVPKGRGKLGRGVKPWAKTVMSVARNSRSGRDWDGDWLTQDSDSEVEIGDLIVVSDLDGEGAVLYVAASVVAWVAGRAGRANRYLLVEADGSKQWAAAMCVVARKWLAMSREERATRADEIRTEDLVGFKEKALKDPTYKFATATGAEAISIIDALLAASGSQATEPDPRQAAISTIRRLMAEHCITTADLEG